MKTVEQVVADVSGQCDKWDKDAERLEAAASTASHRIEAAAYRSTARKMRDITESIRREIVL